MLSSESWERIWEGLGRASSCCKELGIITKIQEWIDLSNQFLIMRNKARAMYKGPPLSESEIHILVNGMEAAQRAAGMLR